jgi:hypothetical protein
MEPGAWFYVILPGIETPAGQSKLILGHPGKSFLAKTPKTRFWTLWRLDGRFFAVRSQRPASDSLGKRAMPQKRTERRSRDCPKDPGRRKGAGDFRKERRVHLGATKG